VKNDVDGLHVEIDLVVGISFIRDIDNKKLGLQKF
jgi:hypothetical protein